MISTMVFLGQDVSREENSATSTPSPSMWLFLKLWWLVPVGLFLRAPSVSMERMGEEFQREWLQ